MDVGPSPNPNAIEWLPMAGTSDDPSIDLFDNPRWLSFEQVHRQIWRRVGDPCAAALDFTEALAWKVRSMRRSPVRFTDQEMLEFEFWARHDLHWDGYRLVVIRRPGHVLDRIIVFEGFIGYAWLPDLAGVWPSLFAPSQSRSEGQQLRPEKSPQQRAEEFLAQMQVEFSKLPPKQKSAWVRDTAFPRMKKELGEGAPWDNPDSLRRALYPKRKKN